MSRNSTTSPAPPEGVRADKPDVASSNSGPESAPSKRRTLRPTGYLTLPNPLLSRPDLSLMALVALAAIRDLVRHYGPALGMRMICWRCGDKLTRAQFIRATKELEAAGLLHVDRTESRGAGPVHKRRNRYTLTDPPPDAGPVERCENRTVAAPRERSEIRTVGESERAENRPVYGAEIAPSNGAKIAPRKEQQELNNNGAASPPPAAPPDDGRSAALAMLLAVGVDEGGDKGAARLAAANSPDHVAAAVAWARERRLDNPAGFIVDVLTLPRYRPELDGRAAAGRAAREKGAARKAERARERAMREFVARLGDDERRRHFPAVVDAVCRENPSANRRAVAADLDLADWSALTGAALPPALLLVPLARLAAKAAAASQLSQRNVSDARRSPVRNSA